MKGNILGRALILYIALFFQVTECSNHLPKTAVKFTEIELDLKDQKESPNYKKHEYDDADHYVASSNKLFSLVRSGENVLWRAQDPTELATKVLVSEYGLTLINKAEEHKQFRFEQEGLVEVGQYELPVTLYMDYTVSTYTHTCAHFNNSYIYQTTKYYRFDAVKMNQTLIYEAKTPEQSAFLVALSGDEITMYLLNEEFIYFKNVDNVWVEYTPGTYESIFDDSHTEIDTNTDSEEAEVKTDSGAEAEDALSHTVMKKRLQTLDHELFLLKEQYESFRNRLVSFNDTLAEVADVLGRTSTL